MIKRRIILLLMVFPAVVSLARPPVEPTVSTGFSAGYQFYRSFSQQKTELKILSGYPVIFGHMPSLAFTHNFYRKNSRHNLKLRVAKPFKLSADNGTGRNLLLSGEKSNYFRSTINYRISWPLFTRHWLEIRHGFTSGVLFESREIAFLSGSTERTSDINLFIGPALSANFPVNKSLSFFGIFDGHFYLPYFNYGKINTRNSNGQLLFESSYYGTYYQTIFRAGVNYRFFNQNDISVGFEKNDVVGFAASKPAFTTKGIVHHKLDRIMGIFVGITF